MPIDEVEEVVESSLGDGDPDVVVTKAKTPFWKRVVNYLRPDNMAFKVAGNHFLITWSNNFEDRDRELFTEKAIDDYVHRVDIGAVPPPELWVWHAGNGVRIGEAEMVGRHGHFVIAVGAFDDSPQAAKAKAYYTRHQRETGVSHGFTYPPEAFDGKAYHSFNTFEISLLPKAVAANPFTNLEQVKESMEMALSEQKRKYLVEVFGDEADRVLTTLEESGKALEEMQMAYKDFVSPEPSPETEVEVKATADAQLKDIIPDLLEGQAEVFKSEAATLKTLKAFQDTVAALQARVEQAEKEAQAARDEVAGIKADLPRRPSTDAETVVAEDELTDAMKNSMKQLDEQMTSFFGVPFVKPTP